VQSRDDGSTRAPIAMVGEAYGHWEGIYDRPFVGPSYNDKLQPWWRDAGLSRDMFYITNAWDQGQPQPHIDRIPESELRAAMDRLHDRLATLEGPDGNGPIVIVPTGNVALYALTGKGKVSFHSRDGRWERPGIQSWRGSILQYEDRKGRRIKVIPTVHPAATFRQPGLEWVCATDWRRIAGDVAFRELRLPDRTHMIAPNISEAIEWMRWTRSLAAKWAAGAGGDLALNGRLACSLDVETPKRTEYATKEGVSASTAPGTKCRMCGHTLRWHEKPESDPELGALVGVKLSIPCRGPHKKGCGHDCRKFSPPLLKPKRIKISEEAYLGCIGYAWDPKISLTIPTTLAYWQDPAAWALVKAELVAFHADPNIDFGGQNQPFDAWWCATEGMPFRIAWDLMNMHRVRVPFSEWHDLAFQGSLYTRQPYWKDEAKDPDSVQRYAHNSEALWTYNGIDNCVQRELLSKHLEALREAGRLEYYEQLEASMFAPLLELSLTGIRVDAKGRSEELARTKVEAGDVAKQINEAAGTKLVAKTAVSNAKMKMFLYSAEGLRLPEQYTKNAKKEKVVTVNVVAIKRLMERFPGHEKLHTVGRFVLRHRRLLKIAAFLSESRVSADGRVYGMFKQDTILGRLSCESLPNDEGDNLQNQDRKLRKYFVADTNEESVA